MRWFGVRCIFEHPANGSYEERVTIWSADSFDAAIELAEAEANEHAEILSIRYLGLAQAYWIADEIGQGAEVFSLLRRSDLSPHEYVTSFFDTGKEISS
jgi:hypothetical protein